MSNKRVSELPFLNTLKKDDVILTEINNITSTISLSTLNRELSKDVTINISSILRSGAVNGQVLTFNGTNWIPL